MVSATLKAIVDIDEVKDSPTTAGTPHVKHLRSRTVSLTDGVTSGAFDLAYSLKEATISSATDLDLYGGISDAFGTTINAVGIVFFYIENHSTTATLTVGGDATQPAPIFADGNETIGPGGFRMGYFGDSASEWGTIGAGSNDILQLTPSAELDYTLILGLRSS